MVLVHIYIMKIALNLHDKQTRGKNSAVSDNLEMTLFQFDEPFNLELYSAIIGPES